MTGLGQQMIDVGVASRIWGRTVFSWNFLANCSASTVLLFSLSQLPQPKTWTAGSRVVGLLARHSSLKSTCSLTVNASMAHVVGNDVLRLAWSSEHGAHELRDDIVCLCDGVFNHFVDLGC
jgi:hypothetical protein